MSTAWNDESCKNMASDLSCLAMRDLALKEAENNQLQLSYLVNDPSCERYHSLADRVKEHSVQATVLNRRLCFTHDPTLKQGSYISHMSTPVLQERMWEQWTKRKDIGKQEIAPVKEINACIWNNQSDDGTPVTVCGNAKCEQFFK